MKIKVGNKDIIKLRTGKIFTKNTADCSTEQDFLKFIYAKRHVTNSIIRKNAIKLQAANSFSSFAILGSDKLFNFL